MSYFREEPEHIVLLRDSMRRFGEQEMPPDKVREWEKEGRFERGIFDKLAKTGVCGLTIDEQYGGAGRDIFAAAVVIEELTRFGLIASGPFIHCAFYGGLNISENGSDEQKSEFLPKLARGEMLMAYGLSEPDVGGDLAMVRMTARKSDNEQKIILNGTKRWCTMSRHADYIICLVKSDPAAPKYQNLSMILVPPDLPGIEIYDIDHLGLRYGPTTDVVFDDVEVPIGNVLGGPDGWGKGWNMLAGRALEVEKIEITAIAFGTAAAAVDAAWAYAQERKQFGKAICGHQTVRHKLVEAKTKLEACRHMLYHAAWLADEDKPCAVETSMAKLFVADTGLEIVLACQQIMGAYGCATEYDMERYVRDMTLMPIVGGSSDIQRNNIANRLGLPRE
jgi:alkylation response protein AidB-like acyl-CoA dehydrogenase